MSRTFRCKNIEQTFNRSYDNFGKKHSPHATYNLAMHNGRSKITAGVGVHDDDYILYKWKRLHTDALRWRSYMRYREEKLSSNQRHRFEKALRRKNTQQLQTWDGEEELILEKDTRFKIDYWVFN